MGTRPRFRGPAPDRIAAQKHHISGYVAAVKDGVTLAKHCQDRLGKTNNGTNCIGFAGVERIDLDLFAEAVVEAVEWAEQEEMFGRNCARPV